MNDIDDAPALGQVSEDPTPADQPRDGFGPTLRQARQNAGLSIADVARALKVAEDTVEALEAESFENLPPAPYVRGYAQRYARLVGVDGNDVKVDFETVPRAETTVPAIAPRSRRTLFADFTRQSWGLLYGSMVAAFVIVIAAAMWWAWTGENTKRDDTDSAVPAGDGPAWPGVAAEAGPAPEVDDESVASPPAQPLDASDSTVEDAAAQASTPRVEGVGAVDDAVARVSPEDAAVEGTSTTVLDESAPGDDPATTDEVDAESDADPDRLVDGVARPDLIGFTFKEDCWVEVRDRNGDLIHGDLGRQGDTLTLRGDAPFSVLVGFSDGVEITFNGKPVPLASSERGDVARLVVGS